MSERARALDVLREARDLMADRLTQYVLEMQEGLLDDARGESYLSEIESLFDQFGTKLTHLNQIINNLPLETEIPTKGDADFSSGEFVTPDGADAAVADDTLTPSRKISSGLMLPLPALPAPRTSDEPSILAPTFHVFAAQMRRDDLLDAARTLSILLDISEARGVQCVRQLHRRWEADDAFLEKVMQLRGEVLTSSYNSALILLAECFGLVGIEAIGVLQTLRSRLGP